MLVFGSHSLADFEAVLDQYVEAMAQLIEHVYDRLGLTLDATLRSIRHLTGSIEEEDLHDGARDDNASLASSSNVQRIDVEPLLPNAHQRQAVRDCALARKRALFLIGFHLEPEILAYFVEDAACVELANDLQRRVLPVVIPWFISGMCQDPQAFCNLVALLTRMWPSETFDANTFQGDDAEEDPAH